MVLGKIANDEIRLERHTQLVNAATELFLNKGFHKTTVREIAAAAGWQMGTLYLYISSKEDVLYLILVAILSDIRDEVMKIERRETAAESLRVAMEEYFRGIARKQREIRLLYRESPSISPEQQVVGKSLELEARDFLAAIIRWGIERGEFRQVNADLVAHNVIMGAHMWALKGWTLRREMSFDSFSEQQFDLLLRGLLPGRRPARNGRTHER
jgi:AcrR family transcriptional regulator